jgi:RNA polymerase sigma-70 factor (ECF subfamily)
MAVVKDEAVQPAVLSDGEIVERVRAGEKALFEVLMRRHNPRVYRAIRSILRDESEVEDAMQQTYLQAYAALGDFEGASAFSTWLTRIAINEALGRLRKRSRLAIVDDPDEEAEDTVSAPPETPEDRAATSEAMGLVERAIDRLPMHYRTVFMLREVDQLSTAETAKALDLTEEAVKIRLHRARAALRETLSEHVDRAAPSAFPFFAPRCDRVVAAVMSHILADAP